MIRTFFAILFMLVLLPFALLGILFAGIKFTFNVGYIWMNNEIIGRN